MTFSVYKLWSHVQHSHVFCIFITPSIIMKKTFHVNYNIHFLINSKLYNDVNFLLILKFNKSIYFCILRFIPGQFKPKTMKLVFVVSPLSTQLLGERAKTGYLGIVIMWATCLSADCCKLVARKSDLIRQVTS
jgi:hypothetical protein